MNGTVEQRRENQLRVQEGLQTMLGQPLSIEAVRSSVPRNFRGNITESFLDDLERSMNDPEMGKIMKENFLTYTNVLNESAKNVTIWDYVNAVKFISYKIMGYSIEESWKKTFPNRAEELVKEGKLSWINKYANGFNKTKIVNKIYEQTLIPSYVLNAPMYQRALNVLNDMIMNDEVRGMAKVKACETILNYTKPPEVNKAEVNVTIKQSDAITELREAAEAFAASMQNAVSSGQKTVGEIIDAEVVKVTSEGE